MLAPAFPQFVPRDDPAAVFDEVAQEFEILAGQALRGDAVRGKVEDRGAGGNKLRGGVAESAGLGGAARWVRLGEKWRTT